MIPSNPYDAKGLLIAAIEDPDPVLFFEPKRIYNGPFDGHHDRPVTPWSKHELSQVPDGHYTVPLGKAKVVREGEALTVLAYGTMVHVALAAVEDNGIDAEVIDLRTLVPLDIETIEESVKKTGRCLVVQEATRTSGFGAELATLVQERCFYHLEAPMERVAGWDTPYPHAYEWVYFPGPIRMKNALKKVARSMSVYQFKLPDIGEGIAEAEIVAWHVQGRRQGRGGPAARRHDDRQGDGRNGKPRSRALSGSWRAKSATRSRSVRCWWRSRRKAA